MAPKVPNAEHMPDDKAEAQRFNRIDRVYYAMDWYPGVEKRVRSVSTDQFRDSLRPYSDAP
jgi:hypothetical protein